MNLISQLYNIFSKTGDVSIYLIKASDPCDQMTMLEKKILNKILINIIYNKLFKAYKITIQGISYMMNLFFTIIMKKTIIESHCLKIRKKLKI